MDTRFCPDDGADSRTAADVLSVQNEDNKGVCVDVVVVEGLDAERVD